MSGHGAVRKAMKMQLKIKTWSLPLHFPKSLVDFGKYWTQLADSGLMFDTSAGFKMELVPPLQLQKVPASVTVWFFAHLFRRAFVKSVTDVGCEFLAHNLCFCLRFLIGFRPGFYVNHSSSSAPNLNAGTEIGLLQTFLTKLGQYNCTKCFGKLKYWNQASPTKTAL